MNINRIVKNTERLQEAHETGRMYAIEMKGEKVKELKNLKLATAWFGHNVQRIFNKDIDKQKYNQIFERILTVNTDFEDEDQPNQTYEIFTVEGQDTKEFYNVGFFEKFRQRFCFGSNENDSSTKRSNDKEGENLIKMLEENNDESPVFFSTTNLDKAISTYYSDSQQVGFINPGMKDKITQIKQEVFDSQERTSDSANISPQLKFLIGDKKRAELTSIKLADLSKQLKVKPIDVTTISQDDRDLMLKCLDLQLNIDIIDLGDNEEDKELLKQVFTKNELALIKDVADRFRVINIKAAQKGARKLQHTDNTIALLNRAVDQAMFSIPTLTKKVTEDNPDCSPELLKFAAALVDQIINVSDELDHRVCMYQLDQKFNTPDVLNNLRKNLKLNEHIEVVEVDSHKNVFISPFFFKKLNKERFESLSAEIKIDINNQISANNKLNNIFKEIRAIEFALDNNPLQTHKEVSEAQPLREKLIELESQKLNALMELQECTEKLNKYTNMSSDIRRIFNELNPDIRIIEEPADIAVKNNNGGSAKAGTNYQAVYEMSNERTIFLNGTEKLIKQKNKGIGEIGKQFDRDLDGSLIHLNGKIISKDPTEARNAIYDLLPASLTEEKKLEIVTEITQLATQNLNIFALYDGILNGIFLRYGFLTKQKASDMSVNDVNPNINIVIEGSKLLITGYLNSLLTPIDDIESSPYARIEGTIQITKDLNNWMTSKDDEIDATAILSPPVILGPPPPPPQTINPIVIPPVQQHITKEFKTFEEVRFNNKDALDRFAPRTNSDAPVSGVCLFQEPQKIYGDDTINLQTINANPLLNDSRFIALQNQHKDLTTPVNMGASFVNTYAKVGGHVNCDIGYQQQRSGLNMLVLADGAGWGGKSRQAAQRAVTGAVNRFNALFSADRLKSGSQIVQALLDCAKKAQADILTSPEKDLQNNNKADLESETTTFNMTVDYEDVNTGDRIIHTLSVGDTKAYVVIFDENGNSKVIDTCEGSRDLDPLNAKDPGGRLGGDTKIRGEPDLRNLSVNTLVLPKGTQYMIMTMSDGVTDNLNPFSLGVSITEAMSYVSGKPIPRKKADWATLKQEWIEEAEKDPEGIAKLIKDYQEKLFVELMTKAKNDGAKTPNEFCKAITNYCIKKTENTREFLNTHNAKIPDDSINYPGKPDHTSIVACATPNLFPAAAQ